ncbi:MAG: outer rane channel protein [Burkholderiaceae bacterium]|nr:outer rane channel protein [Burkholderiaceae bacterium]
MVKNTQTGLKEIKGFASRCKYLAIIGAAAVAVAWPSAGYTQAAAEKPAEATKAAPAKPAARKVKAAKASANPAASCTSSAPAVHVNIPHGKSVTLNLKQLSLPEPAWLRSIADPSVVKISPLTSRVARSQFSLFGLKIGSTNMTFQTKDGRCSNIELSVGADTSAVQAKIRELLPHETDIRVVAAADSLVLTGTAVDAASVDKAMSIAKAFLPKGGGGSATGSTPPGGVSMAGAGAAKGATGAENGANAPLMTQIVINPVGSQQPSAAASSGNIINMLTVAAPQQVMLEVKVAEVSKSLLDKLGMKFNWTTHNGSWTHNLISNFLTGTTTNPTKATFTATKSNGNIIGLDAQKTDGLVKILAEPNVMAVSGQEGSFLAGGKIYIPVPQSNGVGGAGSVTLEEKEFGVGLKFLPTVLAGGRINIRVSPEVSELARIDFAGSSGITGSNIIIPVITTRRAATTVQLYDGQSFAIGGLIKSNTSANINALPMLGEVPVLGALFRSTDFQQDRTELVFVITPRLVKPLPANYTLPTDRVADPNRFEYFLGGRLEGEKKNTSQPAAGTASPAVMQEPAPSVNGVPAGFEN